MQLSTQTQKYVDLALFDEANKISQSLKDAKNIHEAIGILTNKFGAEAGRNLEVLLIKEILKEKKEAK